MSAAPVQTDLIKVEKIDKCEDLWEFADVLERLPRESMAEVRKVLLRHLSACIMVAGRNLALASEGKSPFREDTHLQAALGLMELSPLLMEQLPLEDPKPPQRPQGPPLIPRCPFCGKGPGEHFPTDCPENPDPERWRTFGPHGIEWEEVFHLRKTKARPWWRTLSNRHLRNGWDFETAKLEKEKAQAAANGAPNGNGNGTMRR